MFNPFILSSMIEYGSVIQPMSFSGAPMSYPLVSQTSRVLSGWLQNPHPLISHYSIFSWYPFFHYTIQECIYFKYGGVCLPMLSVELRELPTLVMVQMKWPVKYLSSCITGQKVLPGPMSSSRMTKPGCEASNGWEHPHTMVFRHVIISHKTNTKN